TQTGYKIQYYSSYEKFKSGGKPPLVFLHGWPNSSADYDQFVQYFEDRQHPCIAPDQLGFGNSDKPERPELYTARQAANTIIELLSAEGMSKAVFIGHDCRVWLLCPERVLGLVFISIPYIPPRAVDYDVMNDKTEETFGYACFGYWDVFINEPNLIREHEDAFFNIFYAKDPALWKAYFMGRGQLKDWLLGEGRCETADYADMKVKDRFSQNDWVASTHFYRCFYDGSAWASEKEVPSTVSSLTIAPDNDACSPLPIIQQSMRYFSNGRLAVVSGGHNCHFEDKIRFCSLLEDYLAVFR
ncbi:Alpha/Beta hydrolase protein, partial [Diplogelasinospora grovesii]